VYNQQDDVTSLSFRLHRSINIGTVKQVLKLAGPWWENIELPPVWNTSYLAELIYDLNSRQFLRGKGPTPVTIQYLSTAVADNIICTVHYEGVDVGSNFVYQGPLTYQ